MIEPPSSWEYPARATMHIHDGASTLISIREAALATGLSPKALRRRIERGTLASVMVAGRRQIPLEDLTRRGLMPSEALAGGGRVVDLAPAATATDAVASRLQALESRVTALEAALDGTRSSAGHDDHASSPAPAAKGRPLA